jgi:type IV secretion system protein VirD4
MEVIRYINRLTVLLAGYVAALMVLLVPFGWTMAAAVLIARLCKKGYRYTAYGTARWATVSDLRHMLEGPGLIIGHISGKPSRMEGLKALFNKRMPPKDAVRQFLQTCRGVGYKPENLVRLTDSVHTSIYAPTGSGKGVSCILPFLLTCCESCVVVDFKGENALLTAEFREREFGHKIVILDPFKVVTQ